MNRKLKRPSEKMTEVFRQSFSLQDIADVAQPMIHINCKGRIEIENCIKVLEYEQEKICFCLKGHEVTVEGENLTICSLNPHVTEISGRIFRLSFTEVETK